MRKYSVFFETKSNEYAKQAAFLLGLGAFTKAY